MLALGALAACDWPQFRFSADHSGSSPNDKIAPSNVPGLIQKWSANTGGPVQSSPAAVGGSVYVGSNDGQLHAFNALTGTKQWSVATGGPVQSSPAVAEGKVVVGSDDHHLYAFNTGNGAPAWSATLDSDFGGLSSAPNVTGGAVFAASAKQLYAFNLSDGTPKWSVAVDGATRLSSPSVSGGLVYVASYADAKVWAYRVDNGAFAWSATAPGSRSACEDSVSSPAVVGGVVYVALCPSASGSKASLFTFQAGDGAPVWSGGTAIATSSPSVGSGVVYVGSTVDRTIEAHDAANGKLLWTATTGGAVVSSPALVNGTIYVGSNDNNLYAFYADGGPNCGGTPRTCQPVWTATTGAPIRSSPAVGDANVFAGSDDGRLYAYSLPPIGFGKGVLQGTSSETPTTARFGPDGRLYVAQFDGLIKVYTVERRGANDYVVTATETIDLVQSIPNHDDDGTLNTTVSTRLITGLLVAGSAAMPVIYVSSSDPRIGGGVDATETNLDTNSGIVSRLTKNGTGWQKQDLVRGLPRSEENHATNTLVLDKASNKVFVAQGGNTNMGAPSHNFNFLPEYAYSAAILRVDLNAIGTTTYDLPTLIDEDHPTLTGPFGGNGGKRQAKVTPDSPVQVHAPGFRNPFALVRTRSGNLYAVDNGSNAGWGDVPVGAGPAGTCTNEVNEPGTDQADSLHRITGPGYYGGHANPTRGNQANTFNQTTPQSPVPAANAIECDPRGPSANGSITSFNTATTGMAEYQAGNFANQMNGNLLVAGFHGSLFRVELNAAGTGVKAKDVLFSNVGTRPVDVATMGDADAFPGTIWVPDLADGSIVVFEPNDYGGRVPPTCGGGDDPNLDEDRDGFNNADEIDNQTDPCSAGDAPHDWNRNFVSDLNDPNDDSDGLLDTADPFAVDPNNGRTTKVPISYSWKTGATNNPCAPTPFPSGCPGGLLGLGFTGLMTNGQTNYANLYDLENMTVGGAAGVLTVGQVPPGDANGSTNTQQYAFQYGLDANPASTGVFTAHTRIVGPFAGVTPTGSQSMGLFIGTGDQDNYAKLVVTANGGSPGIQFVKEMGAVATSDPVTPVAMPGPDFIDLYLTVDPVAATVQPSYRVTTGGVSEQARVVGPPTAVPATWLNSSSRGLALGLIATSAGGAPFPATWDLLEATSGGGPAPEQWQRRAPSGFARQEVSYAYSPTTGKFYLAGGGSTVQEAYDPSTDSWSTVAPLPAALDHIQAVELNGLIYYIGGLVNWPGPAVGTVYVYDPVANSFASEKPMPTGRERGAGGVAVAGNKIYYAGGLHEGVAVPWLDVYDPVTKSWASLPDMPEARDHFQAAVVGNRFYAIGGRRSAIDATTTVNQAFDIGTESWVTGLAPLPTARGGFATAVVGTEVLIIGGEGAGKTYNTVEAYNTSTNTWRVLASMPTSRHGIQAATCNGGIYVAAGGTLQGAGGATNVHEVFFPGTPAACGAPR